jgi:KTSC domain
LTDSGDDNDIEAYVFDSSNLASATFNKRTGEAEVVFNRGAVYSGQITPELWDALKRAPSAGRFYAAHMKDLFS